MRIILIPLVFVVAVVITMMLVTGRQPIDKALPAAAVKTSML